MGRTFQRQAPAHQLGITRHDGQPQAITRRVQRAGSVPFAVMALVLLVKPAGLFGQTK